MCLLPLVVSLPTPVKSLSPFYWLPLVSVHWLDLLSSSSWGSHSPLLIPQMLQPPMISVALWWHHTRESVSFPCWELRTGPNPADTSQQGWAEGRDHCPPPAGNALPNTACDAVLFLPVVQAHHCLISFLFHWNLRSSFVKLLSTQLIPSLSWDQHASPSKRTFHFHLLNLMRFPSGHFFPLSRSLKFDIILWFFLKKQGSEFLWQMKLQAYWAYHFTFKTPHLGKKEKEENNKKR